MKAADTLLNEPARWQAVARPSRWPAWFALSAGGILALGGANDVLDLFGESQVWDLSDPLFGAPFRYLLPLAGVAELFVAWLCLFTNKRTLSLGLVAWLVIDFAAYRVVLWTMGWYHPWAFVARLTEMSNISPLAADGIAAIILIYLLIGSGEILWSEHKTAPAINFLKMSCPACGGHIDFSKENLGREISCPHCQKNIILRKPGLLKMTCFFCKEHIEFPAHALGQSISCPHCRMDIRLKESQ